MVSGDVVAVAGLLAQSPEAAQWSVSVLAPGAAIAANTPASADVLLAVQAQDREIVGIVVVRTVACEVEILNLAVLPASRRRGWASGLVQAALAGARSAGARRAFLEVRESNVGARTFYARMGFVEVGRRRAYYSGPMEDALILSRALQE
jgi:[ribosomal protein S18]-alanine N-acetyltransferase